MKITNKNFSIFFVRGDPVKTLFNNFHKGPPYVKIFKKFDRADRNIKLSLKGIMHLNKQRLDTRHAVFFATQINHYQTNRVRNQNER